MIDSIYGGFILGGVLHRLYKATGWIGKNRPKVNLADLTADTRPLIRWFSYLGWWRYFLGHSMLIVGDGIWQFLAALLYHYGALNWMIAKVAIDWLSIPPEKMASVTEALHTVPVLAAPCGYLVNSAISEWIPKSGVNVRALLAKFFPRMKPPDAAGESQS